MTDATHLVHCELMSGHIKKKKRKKMNLIYVMIRMMLFNACALLHADGGLAILERKHVEDSLQSLDQLIRVIRGFCRLLNMKPYLGTFVKLLTPKFNDSVVELGF